VPDDLPLATVQHRRWAYKFWAMDSMLEGDSLLREPAIPRQPAQGELVRQAQALVSAMASFGTERQAGVESERQTIQPVHRLDPTWVSPALM